MQDYVTGRQRNYALALGIHLDPSATGHEVSQMIDKIKPTLKGPPNPGQNRIARIYGISFLKEDSGWDAVKKLWEAILAETYVYSSVRKIVHANWKYYSDSGLPGEWVLEVAKKLMECPERRDFVIQNDNSMSGVKGSAWFRFGKRQLESTAFSFVEKMMEEKPPKWSHDNVVTKTRPVTTLPRQEASVRQPSAMQTKKTNHKPLNRRELPASEQSGCSVIVLVGIGIVVAVCIIA